MKRVQIVPLGRADLRGVCDGIVADNPAAATAYLEGSTGSSDAWLNGR